MDLKRNDPARLGILFVLALSILIVTLFANWIGVSVFGESEHTTLLKVAGLLDDLGGFSEESGLTIAKVAIYLFLGICAAGSALTIYSLFQALTTGSEPSDAGFVLPSILAVIVMLAVLIVNLVLGDETDGLVDGLFVLSASPFYVLAAGIIGARLCRTLKKPTESAEPEATEKRFCVSCKKEVGEGEFCPDCGSKLVTAAALCDQCGEPLPVGALFCLKCGKDLRGLVGTPTRNDEHHCKNCGAVLSTERIMQDGLEYCPGCGQKLTPYTTSGRLIKGVCPSCYNYHSLGNFCPVCGRVVPREVFVTTDETE